MVEILQFMVIAILAGFLGSLVGIGGGMIITPALTILFGIDIKYAIGASIIAVIATSSGSAIAFVRDHVSNMRVGMLLEIFYNCRRNCWCINGRSLFFKIIIYLLFIDFT